MNKPVSKIKTPFRSGSVQESMHALSMCMKGVPLIKSGRMDEALDIFDGVIDIDPDHSCAWFNKGYVLSAEGRYEEALKVFDGAIEAEPNFAPAWIGKGYMLTAMGSYGDALDAFDWAIKLEPSLPDPWNGKGNALTGLARYEEACEAFDAAVAIDPTFALPWYGKAVVLEQKPELEISAGCNVEQCLCRVCYLMRKYAQKFPVSKSFLMDIMGRTSLILLARELSAEGDGGAGGLECRAGKADGDCAIPAGILSAIASMDRLNTVEKSLCSGIINYYFGNPVRALEFFDAVDSGDETNMTGQYYLLRSLKSVLEPSEKETAFALKQAETVMKGLLGLDNEQRYYAGQIFLMAGRVDDAKKCFAGNVQYVQSLYMYWLCLDGKDDAVADDVLKRVFVQELRLIRNGERGFIDGAWSLKPGEAGGKDLIRMIRGYAFAREIEPAVKAVRQIKNLLRFGEYQDLAMHLGW